MTVARGMGGEGQGQGQGELGRGGGGGGRKGARQARHFGPVGPATLGPSGPSLWANQACHSGLIRPVIPRHVRPAQHKARGLATGLKKKIKIWPGPAR